MPSVIQLSEGVAVQGQSGAGPASGGQFCQYAETVNVPEDPPASAFTAVGLTEYTHRMGDASWLTLTVPVPPIVTVPDRAAPPLAVAVIVTVPPPATVAGDTESQSRLSDAAHVQSLRPVTDTSCVPPPYATVAEDGDTLVGDVGQGVGAAWVTVTVWSLTLIVAVRAADVAFASTS